MKKKLSFLIIALMAMVSFAWADPLVESSGNQGSSDTKISGTSYTLDGTFIAGKGGVQQGNMPDKGVKMRTNKGPVVFQVNKGFKITKLEFWGCGNTSTAVDIVSVTVDGGQNLLANTVTLPGKATDGASGDIVLSDIAAEDNITLTFKEGTTAQFVGTWKITYEQTEVIVQEITGVTLNGTALSDADLATLKSTKALTIDGSTLNGAGAVDVTLSSGSTTVTKSFDGTTALYKFTVSNEEYAITVRGVGKKYAENGLVVAYAANQQSAEGADTKAVTMNGITFTMTANDKTFQYGSGNVTLGENVYVPLKLSTGSAVNVTFPDGKKATKVTVYGWSANGNGKLNAMKESAESEKSVDVSNDVYYATNTGVDIYPSVYEYELDNWESLYFNPGGSPSQPFVVMDFTFAEEQSEVRTYAIVGDFTGGWPAEIDDDGSKDVEMTADPTAEGIYTLTIKDFDAEAKKYEYKLRANKSWNVYNLPAEGNQDFVFGTNDYPAGKYDLTFTADVNKHELTLDVVKAEEPLKEYTVQFVNGADWQQVYAYTWTGDGVSSEKVEQLGAWAGTEMGLIDTEAEIDGKKYPVYELKFKAAVEPANIIFSNGRGGEAGVTQTADQEFVDGYRYALVIDDEPVNPDQQEEEIEFTAAGTGTNPMVYTKDHFTYTFDKGSGSTNPAYVTSAAETRLYAKGTLTIKAKASEKIIAISYDATLNANKNGVTPTIDGVAGKTNAGTWDAENWSWTGEDTEVTMTTSGTAGNVGFKGITVTYTDEGGGGDQPVNTYTATFKTNLGWKPVYAYAWSGEGEAVEKFLGDWPGTEMIPADELDNGYGISFTAAKAPESIIFNDGTKEGAVEGVNKTADLAFENGKAYSLIDNSIKTIAELNALANKKEFTFTGNAIVVAHEEKEAKETIDHYIYIKDETGASLIYDRGGAYTNSEEYALKVGNVITAPWTGRVNIYNGLFEVVPTGEEQLKATSTVEVKYPEATPGDVKAENVNQVVEIKGLTIDNVDGMNIKFTIGDALVNGWNQFGIELPEVTEGKTFDVVGAISIYGENIQFQPITITEVVAPVEDVYSVAGSSEALFGTAWDASNEKNDMVKGEDNIFRINYEDVELEAGDIQLKVVKNHSWDTAYPAENYAILVPNAGKYNLTVTFNPETNEVTAQLTSKEAPVEDVYSVAGSSEALFGTTWNEKEGNEMTLTEGKYTWTKEKVALPAGDVKFKVVKNHSWNENWPEEDYVLNIPETAEYTVTITFDEDTKTVAAEATKTGEAQVDDVVVLAGVEAICGSDWNDKDEANKMTESPTAVGLYTITKENLTLNAGTYEYKVVLNGTWYPERDNATVVIENAGIYSIEFTFNKETKETNAIATKTGDPADEKDFSVSFTTDKAWEKVYAYIWNSSIQAPNKWPGIEIQGKEGVYTYEFKLGYDPDFIIFNDGTEEGSVVGTNQTADLPFVDGMIYSLTTEKTTAWAGDPEEAIPATKGIEISATTCKDAGVQAEKIIRIVAKELAVAAPARGLDNTVTGDPNDIPFSIFKADGETELIADKDITVAEDLGEKGKAYEFTATASVAEEITKDGFIIKPKTEKNVAVAAIEVEQAKAPAPVDYYVVGTMTDPTWTRTDAYKLATNPEVEGEYMLETAFAANDKIKVQASDETWYPAGTDNDWVITEAGDYTVYFRPAGNTEWANGYFTVIKKAPEAIVYDFAAEQALIAAGTVEKPGNVGGNQNNGQGFNAYSVKIRNDYKGYAKKEGSTLPETCNIWRRTDRFDQDASWNTAGGVLMPNDREFAIDGLTPGSKVIIEYDATNATNKDIIWAVGENNKLGEAVGAGEGIPVATATIGGVEAVPGQTAIASGAEILVKSVTPAVKGTGYIVLQVKKNMLISKITIIPNEDAVNYAVNVNNAIENGTVKVNRTTAYVGDEVYVTATPAEGYELNAITVTGVNTNEAVVVTDGKFIMPADAVNVSATFAEKLDYYLVGNMTDWKPNAEYKLTANTAAEGVEYMITVDLAADAQFKIAKSNGTTIADTDWYPTGMGNNYGENGELAGAGKYTVYFRPNADGGDDWFYQVIFAQKFYNITVVNCDGMTITPEVTEATAGTKVWATVAMTEGYEPEFPGFTNTDTGDVIEMTEGTDVGMDEETGKVWIIMPAQNLTITAKAAKVSLITLDLSQENGSATCISVNKEDPASFYKKEGKEIYLNVTPDAGYTADITVTAGEDPVEVIAEAGTYHEQAYTHKFIMPAKDVTVKVTFTKSTGINGIVTDDADDNAPIYNLAGQKVDKNYKGVVIKNGKKVYQK